MRPATRWAAVVVCALCSARSSAQSTSEELGDQGEHEQQARQRERAPAASLPPIQALPAHAGMIRIPGGRFQVSSRRGTEPGPDVTLHAYWLDRTEVTVGAYAACVSAGTCVLPARTSPYCSFELGDPLLPISCVGHAAAAAFCRQRGARLPSEAEWEYAARGGTAARAFPWGDAPPTCEIAATLRSDSTAKSCSGSRPARAGTHPLGRSPFGIEDLAGNLEEWVADFYVEPRPTAPPQSGASFVLRGGSWLLGPSYAETTVRSAGSAMEAGPGVGFRCAKGA